MSQVLRPIMCKVCNHVEGVDSFKQSHERVNITKSQCSRANILVDGGLQYVRVSGELISFKMSAVDSPAASG